MVYCQHGHLYWIWCLYNWKTDVLLIVYIYQSNPLFWLFHKIFSSLSIGSSNFEISNYVRIFISRYNHYHILVMIPSFFFFLQIHDYFLDADYITFRVAENRISVSVEDPLISDFFEMFVPLYWFCTNIRYLYFNLHVIN